MMRARAPRSAWGVLRLPDFRAIWIADFASNIGSFAQVVGAGWLMTSLTNDPNLVALIQTASSLPLFALAIPAGVLADLIDRRRLIRDASAVLAALAMILAAVTLTGHISPRILLAGTFMLAIVAALQEPAWGALIPEIVSEDDLPSAIALNGLNFNLSRVLSPPIAGVLIALAGPAFAFFLNGLSFLPTVGIMQPHSSGLLPSLAMLRDGISKTLLLARSSVPIRRVLARNGAFGVCSSALFALLPLYARHDLNANSAQFGLLFGALGAGSVAVAQVIGRLRQVFGISGAVFAGTVVLGGAIAGLGVSTSIPIAYTMLFLAGLGWLTVLSSLNTSIQFAVPPDHRAAGFALYLVTSQGVTAFGALLWGAFASAFGVASAFVSAGSLFVVLGILTRHIPLPWANDVKVTDFSDYPGHSVSNARTE